MAIAGGRADYVQLFLNAGMKVNDARFAKRPLLHLAAMQDRAFIVKMLLEAGADKNALDEHSKRAVDYAKGEAAQLLK
jgi:ankyrin repeat protein